MIGIYVDSNAGIQRPQGKSSRREGWQRRARRRQRRDRRRPHTRSPGRSSTGSTAARAQGWAPRRPRPPQRKVRTRKLLKNIKLLGSSCYWDFEFTRPMIFFSIFFNLTSILFYCKEMSYFDNYKTYAN